MAAPWDRRTPQEQQRAEGLTLSTWLPAAITFSEYWAKRADALGIDPDSVRDREGLRRFPLTREGDVLRDSDGGAALLMRPTESQVKRYGSTSALLGIAQRMRGEGEHLRRRALLEEYKSIHVHRAGRSDDLAIAYSRSDLDRLHQCGARAAAVLGLDDADYLISAVPMTPTLEFFGVYHLALGASMLALHPRGDGDGLDRVGAGAFGLVPATAVAVLRHEAIELAEILAEQDSLLDRVATVVLVGSPPDDEERGEILEAWLAAGASPSVKVLALWAPSMGRALWAESEDGTPGLVTYPDLEVVEVVDALTGLRTDSGAGDLVITSAGWHGTALLRFQTGVYIEQLTEARDAGGTGRTVPRIVGSVVEDAWQPSIEVDGETFVADFRGAAAVFAQTSGVDAWHVVIPEATKKHPHDRLIVELSTKMDDDALATLGQKLNVAMGAPIHELIVADPATIQARVEHLGSVFADLR